MANKLVLNYDEHLATTPLTTVALTNRQAVTSSLEVTTDGNGTYVAYSATETWLSEDDGVTWEAVSLIPAPSEPVFWTGSRWLNGFSYSSIDLRSWSTRTQTGVSLFSPLVTFRLNGYVAVRVQDQVMGQGYMSYKYLSSEDTWSSTGTNYSSSGPAALVLVNNDETEAVVVQGTAIELITDITSTPTISTQNPISNGSFDSQDVAGCYWVGGGYDTTDSKWYLFGSIVNPGGSPPAHLGQLIWVTSTDGLSWGTINLETFVGYPGDVIFDGTYWWITTYVNATTSEIVRFDGTTFTRTTLTATGDGVMAGMAGMPSANLPLPGINGTLLEVNTGEPVSLASVSATLTQDVDLNGSYETTVETVTVRSNGDFFFDIVEPGNYRIAIGSLPTGYSGPAAQTFVVSAGETETRTFTFNAATIFGHVFLDPAVSGVYTGAEVGVADYRIDLYKNNVFQETAITGVNGLYEFSLLDAATYRVEVFDPDGSPVTYSGYNLTTPGVVEFVVTTDTDEQADFGLATGTVTGVVFRDGDGDGLDDQGLAYPVGYPQFVHLDSLSTSDSLDGSQNFQFNNVLAGTYKLFVADTSNNDQYMLTNGNASLQISTDTYSVVEFTIGIGDTLNFDLGVAEPATPVEIDFIDVDNDGTFVDPPDYTTLSISKVVTIERSDIGVGSYSAFTFDDNRYGDYRPGDYRLTYISNYAPFGSLGYVETCSPIEISLGEGDTPNIYFGATELLGVFGTVYLDENYDGVYSAHPGIAGITVNLMDGVTLIDTAVTDVNGDYSLSAPAGTYTVVVEPGAYLPTTSVEVVTSLGEEILFGLIQPGNVAVHVWDDVDGDGVLDGGETTFVVGGVEVGIYEGLTLIDSATVGISGETTFSLMPGSYVVRIISVPMGYQATTGDRSLTLVPEESDSVNVGVRLDLGQPVRPSFSGWGFLPIA